MRGCWQICGFLFPTISDNNSSVWAFSLPLIVSGFGACEAALLESLLQSVSIHLQVSHYRVQRLNVTIFTDKTEVFKRSESQPCDIWSTTAYHLITRSFYPIAQKWSACVRSRWIYHRVKWDGGESWWDSCKQTALELHKPCNMLKTPRICTFPLTVQGQAVGIGVKAALLPIDCGLGCGCCARLWIGPLREPD